MPKSKHIGLQIKHIGLQIKHIGLQMIKPESKTDIINNKESQAVKKFLRHE